MLYDRPDKKSRDGHFRNGYAAIDKENTFKIQTEEPVGQVAKACPDVCTVIVGSRLNTDK